MKLMFVLFTMFSIVTSLNAADDEEIYIVVSGIHSPSIGQALRTKIGRSHVISYPITYQKSEYSEEIVKKAFEEFLLAKDDGGSVTGVESAFYKDRSEAIKHYKEATTNKKPEYRRVTFSRAHIEKTKKKFISEQEKNGQPAVLPGQEKPARNLDDIYD